MAHDLTTFQPSRFLFNPKRRLHLLPVQKNRQLRRCVWLLLRQIVERSQAGCILKPVENQPTRVGGFQPLARPRERGGITGEVSGGGVGADLSRRVSQSITNGDSGEVDAEGGRQDGILAEDVVSGGRNVLAGVAFAGEEERAGTEGKGMGGEKGLECGEEVGGDGRLFARDGNGGGRGAEAGAEGIVDEEKGEAAVDAEGGRQDGILAEDVVGGGRNVLAGVAFAGEEERAGTEGKGMGGEKGLECGEEVGSDGRLFARDGNGGGRGAEAGAEGIVDEEKGEAAVP
ncbi:hypothetical protein IEQ34_006683 [Dendrobium chrysotoxum]|uniref:Uncharacterized protein n=1 Tax=Dendrobium chrysotoxum TaxID=161865 RepID=A0AAV7H678_DENCH|nr:hypothetical protein IEQ34_006683 [Dendrobium chrysotoxum]